MNKKIKVIVDDVEMEVLVSEEELAKLTEKKQKAWCERVHVGKDYWYASEGYSALFEIEQGRFEDNKKYKNANYYADRTIAENNARADKLMRQLRRFAAENCEEVPWDNEHGHYGFYYDYIVKDLAIHRAIYIRDFVKIYFDTEENAQRAIDTFKDELLWYFTEYRDRV